MASALRSVAAAAGRAVRHGLAPRSAPAQPTRHHLHCGQSRNVGWKDGLGSHRPGPDGKVDVTSQKLEMNLAKRQYSVTPDKEVVVWQKSWMEVIVVAFSGLMVGKVVGAYYLRFERGELFAWQSPRL